MTPFLVVMIDVLGLVAVAAFLAGHASAHGHKAWRNWFSGLAGLAAAVLIYWGLL